MRVAVQKLHGLGNEFLVVVPVATVPEATSEDEMASRARRLCTPSSGPGADGLIVASWSGGDLVMVLHNADGSRAEMSGNGIRCLVHAVHRHLDGLGELRNEFRVLTDAGVREVTVLSSSGDDLVCSVGMGPVTTIDAPEGWSGLGCHPDRPVAHLSLGNPHSVVGVDDVAEVDLVSLGALVPQVNLEIVAPGVEPGTIRMRVHERGVGVTAACGTGACAAAVAARRWGLVPSGGDEVEVLMDGGRATVRVGDTGAVTLTGSSTWVDEFGVDW